MCVCARACDVCLYTLSTAPTIASFYTRRVVDLTYISSLTSRQIFNEHECSFVSCVTRHTYQFVSCSLAKLEEEEEEKEQECLLFAPICVDTVERNNYMHI